MTTTTRRTVRVSHVTLANGDHLLKDLLSDGELIAVFWVLKTGKNKGCWRTHTTAFGKSYDHTLAADTLECEVLHFVKSHHALHGIDWE